MGARALCTAKALHTLGQEFLKKQATGAMERNDDTTNHAYYRRVWVTFQGFQIPMILSKQRFRNCDQWLLKMVE